MRSCLFAFCDSSSRKLIENLQFFKVTTKRREKWLTALNRDPSDRVYKDANVCSRHFHDEDFIMMNNKRCLKEDAVPTINLKPSVKTQLLPEMKGSSTTVKTCTANVSAVPSISTFDFGKNSVEAAMCSTTNLQELTTNSKSFTFNLANRRTKRKMNFTSTDSEGLKGSPKRNRKILRTFHNYCKSPRKLNRSLTDTKKCNSKINQ